MLSVARGKLAFIGHTFRKEDICKDLLTASVYGKRGRDRPKARLSDNIREFGGSQCFVGLYRVTQERRAWKATVAQLNELSVN